MVEAATETLRQRLDKWLWHARFGKSRTLCADMVKAGHVRVNGLRVTDPAKTLRGGDVLTLALARRAVVIRVLAFAERRGPPEKARLLYEDATLTP